MNGPSVVDPDEQIEYMLNKLRTKLGAESFEHLDALLAEATGDRLGVGDTNGWVAEAKGWLAVLRFLDEAQCKFLFEKGVIESYEGFL
jgi:hypothetical protein